MEDPTTPLTSSMRPSRVATATALLLGVAPVAAQTPRAPAPPASSPNALPARYEPTWASLDRRPTPAWYEDAKLGIFVHWGVYSVPAWAPTDSLSPVDYKYAEWYQRRVRDDSAKGGPFWRFHERTYGPRARYEDIARDFRAELWEPARWAELFARSGARYVVLTSKHHDGFALWPSAQSPRWNSVDVGPHRDLAGELAGAVRGRGLKFGLYYSLYEWYHPLYTRNASDPRLARYVGDHMLPQLRDLVARYRPAVVWTDGEWEHPSAAWRSTEFLAWLYNAAPNRDEVVVNDRWGKETRSRHGGFYTSEYGLVNFATKAGIGEAAARHAWEENRGVGHSFGYNRNEDLSHYLTSRAVVHLLVDVVSRGGNLLLNVGPTADGRIPVVMQQRLTDLGAWLQTNGEGIYGTRRWREAADGPRVRYTAKGSTVYAIALDHPGRELVLRAPQASSGTAVTLLGHPAPLRWRAEGGRLWVEVPPVAPDDPALRHAYVFRLTNVR